MSAIVFFTLSEREHSRFRAFLVQRTDQAAAGLQRDIDHYVEKLDAIAAFYAASQNVERDEFATFVHSYLVSNPGFIALEWVPRVSAAERSAFVEKAAQEGLPGYRLTELDPSGGMADAGERTEYFPIYYSEPAESNKIALGFDHGSQSERLQAMYKACDYGTAAATKTIPLFRLREGEKGVIVFRPIYGKQDKPADSPVTRRAQLMGFAAAVLNPKAMADAALQKQGGPNISFYLFDSTSGGEDRPFYSGAASSSAPSESTAYGRLKGSRFFASRQIQLTDHVWELVGISNVPAGHSIVTWRPWAGMSVILLFGVLAALLLGMGAAALGAPHSIPLLAAVPRARRIGGRLWGIVIRPGIKLMHRLPYPKKFVLISMMFILPLGLTMFVLLSELESRIQFSQKEIFGAQYLRPLQDLLEKSAQVRRTSYLYRNGEASLRPELIEIQSRIREDFRALNLADAKRGRMFGTSAKLEDLAKNWSYLEDAVDRLDPADQDRLYQLFIKQARGLISLVGDASNLILDPDLDTYYLMDTVLLKIPEIQDVLSETKIFSGSTISDGLVSVADESEFIRLSGLIRFNVNEVKRGLEVAFQNNPARNVEKRLKASLGDFENGTDHFLNFLEGDIINAADSQFSVSAFTEEIQKTAQVTSGLRGQAIGLLEELLQRRIDRFRYKKWIVELFCAAMLILVLYIWLAFYHSVMRTVLKIEEASSRMLYGEISEVLTLETADELGRVVQSFNQIAVGLRHERDQAVEGKAKLHAIYESSPFGVFLADEKGALEYTNSSFQRIYGLGSEEALREGWLGTAHPADAEAASAEWKSILSEGKAREIVHRLLRKDGETLWVRMSVSPVTGSGKTTGYVGVVEDVTKSREIESQLLQWQKMESIGTLAGGVAHDLNNQLTPIRGYLDLIMHQIDPKNPAYPLLAEANQAAIRSAELVERLVNFSKPSNRRKEAVAVSAVLDDLKKFFSNFLPSTIRTEFKGAEGELWILVNSTEIQTVFTNLAANARDAMPQGGSLRVGVERVDRERQTENKVLVGGSYACFSVRDSGVGMPAAVINRIFEPFFTTKERWKGTGLGLTMVFQIVRDHGGWIEVSSELLKGTEFRIYLPLCPKGKREAASPNGNGKEALPTGKETILFADDEEPLRNMGKVFLERLGYKVILAADAEEAVRVFSENPGISAAVLDVTMPKLTGRDMVHRIFKLNPQAKILLASGYTAETSPEEFLAFGAGGFIQKPYTIHPLAHALRRILDR